MNLTKFTAADLRKIATLVDEKEKLVAEKEKLVVSIALIDTELAGLSSGRPGTPGKSSRGARTGTWEERLIEVLRPAGREGRSLQELAAELSCSSTHITAFFSSGKGKNHPHLRRIEHGRYAWIGTERAAPEADTEKRGPSARKIIDCIRAAGPEGVSPRDIAERTGLSRPSVHTYLNAYGSKISQITKPSKGIYVWKE